MPDCQRIAIIGASELQLPLIHKAKAMGMETHVFAYACNDVGETAADHFYPISIVEKDAILAKCREIGVHAIASIASDLAVLTVNYVSRALGFPCNAEKNDLCSTNKYLMRGELEKAGLLGPRYVVAEEGFDASAVDSLTFPVIVKPVDRSGSRGVFKIEKRSEIPAAVEESRRLAFSHAAIIEEYIEGEEYSCECISFEGKHRLLAITKKHTTGAPRFIETGHDEPSDIPETFHASIEEVIFRALDCLGVRYGASHSEFKFTSDHVVRIIEIGSRMGGDYIGSDLVFLSTGYDYVGMVIDVACGREPRFVRERTPKKASVRFILSPEDLAEQRSFCRQHPECVWRASLPNDASAIVESAVIDSATRFGYCITIV